MSSVWVRGRYSHRGMFGQFFQHLVHIPIDREEWEGASNEEKAELVGNAINKDKREQVGFVVDSVPAGAPDDWAFADRVMSIIEEGKHAEKS